MKFSFVLASEFQRLSQRFDHVTLPEGNTYRKNYNIIPGGSAFVITNDNTLENLHGLSNGTLKRFSQTQFKKSVKNLQFGLSGVDKKGTIMPIIRAEGDRNLTNDPNYTGAMSIFLKFPFKRLLRQQRCLVLADAFILNKDDKAFLVYLRNKNRPFAFAGIWNTVERNGANITTFGIMSIAGNQLMRKLGSERMPVILNPSMERRWLNNDSDLATVLSLLKPIDVHHMNAYPISPALVQNQNNVDIVKPIGSTIYQEPNLFVQKRKQKEDRDTGLSGWGESVSK
jgi:putative SOS response-associated peptidase YedK